ncbi:MAG: Outer rane lipoprotein [Verrucomicrobiota bacterium]
MGALIRVLVLLVLAAAVFGGGGYYTYLLYVKPDLELQREKDSPVPAQPAVEDPTLVEYAKCLRVEEAGDPLAARRSFEDFLENYPDSSKAEEARYRLGAIQMQLLFTPRMTPGKQVYVVKSGDVLNKVSHRLKVPVEMLMAMNAMEGSNLRVGQRLLWVPADFSTVVDRKGGKVVVLKGGEFFAQCEIRATRGSASLGPPKKGAPLEVKAKVVDKAAWKEGQRMGITEKGSREALHWIVLQPGGHTLYAEPGEGAEKVSRPSSGYGLDPDRVRELSALLRKNETVTIR